MNEKIENLIKKLVIFIGLSLTLFQIITASVKTLPGMQQRSIHLGLGLALVFLTNPIKNKCKTNATKLIAEVVSVLLAILSLIVCFYVIINWLEMASVMRTINPTNIDMIFGMVLIVLVLLGTYCKIGFAMPLIAMIFLLYSRFGQVFPSILRHADVPIKKIVSMGYMTTEGIFSSTLGVSSTQVYIFLLLGQMLEALGGSEFFLDLANSIFGRLKGGPAKVSVFGSALFGSISGSAVANVAGTGTITIPLMKKVGYDSVFAGAVESVASTGGLVMPPIMGAAAFVMAETIGVPYFKVCVAAIVPAILYYYSVYITVHFRAGVLNLKGLEKEQIKNTREVLKNGGIIFMPPLVVLVIVLAIFQLSCGRACFYCCLLLFVLSLTKKEMRNMWKKKFISIFVATAKSSLTVIMACACAGLVLLGLQSSGLILKISNIMISLANGNLLVLLVLIMLTSLILGMGLPASACYVVLAVLAAPALVELGVPKMVAHLFVLYFGAMSAITPPVAMAAFAAGPIAETSSVKIGFAAFKMAIPAFLIAFCMALQPELCLIGSGVRIVYTIFFCVAGVTCLSIGLQGYFMSKVSLLFRIIWVIAGCCMIIPGTITSCGGLIMASALLLVDIYKNKKVIKLLS